MNDISLENAIEYCRKNGLNPRLDEHDANVRADAIKEFVTTLKRELNPYTGNSGIGFCYEKMCKFADLYLAKLVEEQKE